MWQIVEEWDLLEVSFTTFYGIELEDAYRTRSWRWFCVKVRGLLMNSTPIARHFAPEPEQANEDHSA
jgi:hypothetical protein